MRLWNIEVANAALLKRAKCSKYASQERLGAKINSCLQANEGIETLAGWLNDRGWELFSTTTRENVASFDLKRVFINSAPWPDHQLIILAHEVGHIIIDGRRDYDSKWGRGYLASPYLARRSNIIYRTTILREESNAWDVGVHICERLGIQFDQRILERARASCIAAYARWCVDKTGKYRLVKNS